MDWASQRTILHPGQFNERYPRLLHSPGGNVTNAFDEQSVVRIL